MVETWLRTNRRVIALAFALPATLAALGAWMIRVGGELLWTWLAGGLLIAASLSMIVYLVIQFARPRLARRGDELLVYLKTGLPIAIPLADVECFFLGQTMSPLQVQNDETKVASVVVRLAETATQWRNRDVKPALGKWKDAYITIHGVWCERLSRELLNGLNDRLRDAKRTASG